VEVKTLSSLWACGLSRRNVFAFAGRRTDYQGTGLRNKNKKGDRKTEERRERSEKRSVIGAGDVGWRVQVPISSKTPRRANICREVSPLSSN